jgi:hypothetical protein
MTRRVIVCGSRRWHDREAISERLGALVNELAPDDPTIVHGGAHGADTIAGEEAQKHGLLVEEHPAWWQGHGKAAGPIRNEEMAALGADRCIAFWDGRSTGTADMIARARASALSPSRSSPVTRRTSKHGTTYTEGSQSSFGGWESKVCFLCGEPVVKSRQNVRFQLSEQHGARSWHTACEHDFGSGYPGEPLSVSTGVSAA